VKSFRSVSFGIVCGGVCCLIIFVFGTATVRVTVFVSSLAIFFANVTTLALDASINSSAAHFVSASTASIWLRMMLRVFCMSCNAVLFTQLFINLQIGVGKNHHLTFVSTPPLKTAARKFTV